MDEGKKILLVNLAKGKIGEDAASLLGALLVTKIGLAGLSRADMAAENRRDFYLYPGFLPLYRRVPELCHFELSQHALGVAEIPH